MREGTIKVREVIGHDVSEITDQKIQEALWHYFYDVEKSVNYLLNLRTAASKKKVKELGGKKGQGVLYFYECLREDVATGAVGSYGLKRSGALLKILETFE